MDAFDVYKSIGSRLRLLREESGLDVADLAKTLGCTEKKYEGYEAGKKRIDVETLKDAACFYGVTMDYAVGLTDRRD